MGDAPAPALVDQVRAAFTSSDTRTDQDLVKTEVIADEWDLAPKTLDNWRSRRIGPPYVKINGVVRYSRRATAEWLASQNQGVEA